MTSALALGVLLGGVVIAVVYSLLADELRSWVPYLARRLVRSAAAQLPAAERARYRRDWLAELKSWEDRPLSSLAKAVHIRWRVRGIRESVLGVSLRGEHSKRVLDVGVSIGLLLVLAPLMLLVALLVRLDSRGPAFYPVSHLGRDGKHFRLLRFRSIFVEEPHRTHGGFWDFRMTRVGCLLRRWSLDELPQLLNVLRGDMSLVGPRSLPYLQDVELSGVDESTQRDFKARASVRPGFVAPSQLDELSMPRPNNVDESIDRFNTMIQRDAEYARSRSFAGDLRLLLVLPFRLLRHASSGDLR